MNTLIWAGSILAILTYLPLWKQIRTGKADQNLFSWVLWCILDAIAAATIVAQGGNFLLPMVYTVGSFVTSLFISRSGNKASWTWFETLVASLVLVSMMIWYFSGDKIATIASTLAMLIAGIPQLIDAWKKPQNMPFLVYISYVVANCLSIAGGKNWSIKERFYPVAAGAICFLLTALAARKFWLKPAPTDVV